jgi:hypothetical protein
MEATNWMRFINPSAFMARFLVVDVDGLWWNSESFSRNEYVMNGMRETSCDLEK